MTSPPPKPMKPGEVKVVRALFNYEAQAADELGFEEGDLLYVIDTVSSTDWWRARSSEGKEGLVPSNYVNQQTAPVTNPAHEASKRGNSDWLSECLRNGVSRNGLDQADCTPLHWAALGGHADCIQMLLGGAAVAPGCSAAKLNVQNRLGETALHGAALRGHADCVRLLLKAGASGALRNSDSYTPYQLARDPECAALLRDVKSVNHESYIDEEDSD